MTEKELLAGQMYLSALFRIGELKQENDRLKRLLESARETICGLADQQAMPADWWREPLAEINSALEALK